MKKALKLSLLLLLVLSLASCDWPWDDDDDDVNANAGGGEIVSDSNDTNQAAAAAAPTTTTAEKPAEAAAQETASNQGITENGRYVGRTNGNRPTWYFSKTMSRYPSTFKFSDGCSSFTVKNNGHRFTTGAYVIKQSDVPGRGMAALSPASCGSRSAKISY